MKNVLLAAGACLFLFTACDKTPTDPQTEAKLVFKLKLDPTQQRLDAFANPATVPAGHAAQNPQFNGFSAHKIELVPNNITPVNSGDVVYHGAETSAGGGNAVDFSQAIIKNDGDIFLEVPLKDVDPATYQYIRVSVSYQNYDVLFNVNNIPTWPSGTTDLIDQKGTVASFVGFNTYIQSFKPKSIDHSVNANKIQGYWAFETDLDNPYNAANAVYSGDAQGTTVVNPLSGTVPTPPGSCLVTGKFEGGNLVVTGEETADVVVELSFSTNNSFEWEDNNGNGKLDIDVSANSTEKVVDMGLRGLKASVK